MKSFTIMAVLAAFVLAWCPAPQTAQAQDSSATGSTSTQRYFKKKPTKREILRMNVEVLRDLELEELTELANIVGVSSIEELFDMLVTTASKSAEKIIDAPGVVSVITAREIEQFGARTLTEVLNYMPGMGVLNNYFNRNGMSIRGDQQASPYSNHVLVLVDGRPFRENMYVGNDMDIYGMFPVASIERIEVIRGPGSVLYGTSAYSGVINIITKIATKNTAAASVRLGSFGTTMASFDGTAIVGGLKIAGGVNYMNQTSWTQTLRSEPSPTYSAARDTTWNSRQNGVSGNVSLEYGNLRARATYISYNADILGTLPDFPTRYYTRSRLNADIGYKHAFSDAVSSGLNVTYSRYMGSHDFDDQSTDVVAELTNYIKPASNLNIILGGLVNLRSGQMTLDLPPPVGRIPLVAPYNQVWWSVYAQADWTPIEPLKFIAGAQVNKIERQPANIVPRVGAIWSITRELSLKALWGQAFRGPSAFELGITVPGVLLGDSTLTPELVSTADIELFYRSGIVQASLVYFNSNQSNLINQAIRPAPLEPKHRNEGTFRSQGLELEGKIAPTEELYFLGSFTYQTNVLNERFTNSTPIPNVMARIGAGYNADNGLSVGVFNTFYGRPEDVSVVNPMRQIVNPVPQAFNLLSVNVNLDITQLLNLTSMPSIILNARVENLLNENIWQPEWLRRNVNSLPLMPGRGFYGGLTVRF
jgi:outer membrane receptor for ferrienterochelin and colicins